VNTKLKVLVIDDDAEFQAALGRATSLMAVDLLQAETLEDGERLFAENPDVSVIAIDACIPGVEYNSEPLARKIAATFKGPFVAISSVSEYRESLVEAGCTDSCIKLDLVKKLKTMVGNR
jgi:DNA-binding NtrC family response regulator